MKTYPLFFLILFYQFIQAQNIIWQNTIGGLENDLSVIVAATADGGSVLAGYSYSGTGGDKSGSGNGVSDYWIVKLDPFGNIQWEKTIGGNGSDESAKIIQCADGGYLVGGKSASDATGDKTEGHQYDDIWILKLDASGNITWQNTIGGSGNDACSDILQNPDGSYIIAGWSQSDMSPDKSENCIGLSDYWILKLDNSGEIEWENTIGGSGDDRSFSILNTNDGGYLVGGESSSDISGDKTENDIGYGDIWLVKLNSSGDVLWEETIGGTGDDGWPSMVQSDDGGYAFACLSESSISGDKTEANFGWWDWWVFKTDSLGNLEYQNTIGGNDDDLPYDIAPYGDNGYFISGYSSSPVSGNKTEDNYDFSQDFWVVTIDSACEIVWQKVIGGMLADNAFGSARLDDNRFIISGISVSGSGYDKSENCIGGYDYWVMEYSNIISSVTGNVFADLNSDFIQNAGELSLEGWMVNESATGNNYFTNSDGSYYLSVPDTGVFTVSTLSTDYFNALPLNYEITFTAAETDEIDSLNDFALQPTGTYNDLCMDLLTTGSIAPGFDINFNIQYENAGTVDEDAVVVVKPGINLSFVSADVDPLSVTADSITWNFTSLAPLQSGTINVVLNCNLTATVGGPASVTAYIQQVAGELNIACNYDTCDQKIIASLDPNEIIVSENELYAVDIPDPQFLNYTITFQNTGTGVATFIQINDTLPVELNNNTIEILNSSHTISSVIYYNESRQLKFSFDSIMLPDNSSNELESHGFVQYRIKPVTTLSAGDEIHNSSAIYFDYNPPVTTNTAITKIVESAEIIPSVKNQLEIQIEPNPTDDYFNLELSHPITNAEIIIYDLQGKKVMREYLSGDQYRMSCKVLAPGGYILQVRAVNLFIKPQLLIVY
ncbi:MAG: T9SS type A sorting domain-containing protein [Chitinophagales bacterium]